MWYESGDGGFEYEGDSTPIVSDQQIVDWFLANPTADDKTIAATMDQFSLKPEDIARATGSNLSDVQSRYETASTSANTAPGGYGGSYNLTGGVSSLPTDTAYTWNGTGGVGGVNLPTDTVLDTSGIATLVSPVTTVTSPVVTATSVTPTFTDTTLFPTPVVTATSPTVTDTTTAASTVVASPTVEQISLGTGIDQSVINQINSAWGSGDFAATGDIIAKAGLTPAQIKAYYGLDDATMDFVMSTGVFATKVTPVSSPVVTPVVTPTPVVSPVVTPVVSTSPVVSASPVVSTSVSPTGLSLTPTTTIYGRQTVDALDVPGYGVVANRELEGWEPWRLTMLGITKNADGTFSYAGGPAWETSTGSAKSLFDQINGISNLQGMEDLISGGATGKADGGLGSKEAVIWDFANKLAAAGITSLSDIGQRTVTRVVQGEGGAETVQETELYNKKTGEAFNVVGTSNGSNQTEYNLTFTSTGLAIPSTSGTKSDWVQLRDTFLPVVMTAISFAYPAAAPYIQAFNAAKAAKNGQWMQAALSGLSAASGFSADISAQIDALANAGKFAEAEQLFNDSWLAQNAGTLKTATNVASLVNAATSNNAIAAINAGLNIAGSSVPAELRTAVNWGQLTNSFFNNDYVGMANAAAALTNSTDLKVAASAANFLKAFNSDNPNAIMTAGLAFGNTIKGLGDATTTNASTTNVSTTPTTTVADGSNIVVGTDSDGNPVTLDQIESLFATTYPSSSAYASLNNGVVTDAGSGGATVYEVTNPSKQGDIGYGWKYFSDGTAISPTGQVYQDNKLVTLTEEEKAVYQGGVGGAVTAASLISNSPQIYANLSNKVSASEIPVLINTLKNWWEINPTSQYKNANEVDTEAFRSYLKAQGVSDTNIDYVVDAAKGAVGDLISKGNVGVDTTTAQAKTILDTIGTKAGATEADAATSAANILKTISSDSLAAQTQAQKDAKEILRQLAIKSGQAGFVDGSVVNTIFDAFSKTAKSGSNDPIEIVRNLLSNSDATQLAKFGPGVVDDLVGILGSPWAISGGNEAFKRELNSVILSDPTNQNWQEAFKKANGYDWIESDAGRAWANLSAIDTGSGSGGIGQLNSTLDAKGNVLYSTPVTYETVAGGNPETYTAYYNPATGETRYSLSNKTGAISDFASLSTVKPYLDADGNLTQEVKASPTPGGSKTILFYDQDGKPVYKDDLDKITTFDPNVTVKPVVTPAVTTVVSPVVSPEVSTSPSASTKIIPAITTSPEVSPVVSPTVEVSPTVKPTVVVSPTTQPTVEVSPTVKPTVETSPTLKPTVQVSPSVSPAVSPSISPAVSPSVSPAVSPSVSPAVSPSVSPAVSPSVSPSVAVSPSVSPSVAVSPSVSPSVAVSPSVSPSVAVSPSVSPSVQMSPTVSTSVKVSVTPSVSPVVSITPSITPVVSITPSITPVVSITPSISVTPVITPEPSITPSVSPSVSPSVTPSTKVSVKVSPTPTKSAQPFTMPQAQAIAAAFGIPALANVFYYGKEFGSKKQKLNKKGELEEEEYRPLSVTKAGAEGELLEDIAEEKKNKENNANDALDLILGKSSESMSFDDLLNIVKGG